jgi:hypothetical protein
VVDGLTLSSDQEALVPFLRAHWDHEEWWRRLQALNEETTEYVFDLYNWVETLVNDANNLTELPLLSTGQEVMAGLTEVFFEEGLRLAAVLDMSDPARAAWPRYQPGSAALGLAPLPIGQTRRKMIAWAPVESHESIVEVHKSRQRGRLAIGCAPS